MTAPKHDDRDMNDAVHSWLHENDEPTPDRNRHIGRIMGRVDETKQRRKSWPLNPFGRRAVHSAERTEGAAPVARRGVAALTPVRVLYVTAVLMVAVTALTWIAARPQETAPLPAGWWGDIDPVDEALFERYSTSTWLGPDSTLEAVREVYAEYATHTALWLDGAERAEGVEAIWSDMVESERVEGLESERIRLPDHPTGAHQYFTYTPALDHTICLYQVADERITRHDCILPMTYADVEAPMSFRDLAPTTSDSVSPSAIAAREELSTTLSEASRSRDRELMEQVVSPSIIHHVRNDNQHYTFEGLDEYWIQFGWSAVESLANIDLPAPEGTLRWANFSSVGQGALCDFWARDGLIVRHDCIAPAQTSFSSEYLEPLDD